MTTAIEAKPRAMRDVFIEELTELMLKDQSLFFLSADFGSPALDRLREELPDRFMNVGIAEQNMINLATGLSLEGFKVVAYAIAPFVTMRCYEQIRVNLSILSQVRSQLNVALVGVGVGFSYDVSGPTHHCLEDLAIMRALPRIKIYSPSDYLQAGTLAGMIFADPGIKYLRFDGKLLPPLRERASQEVLQAGFEELISGKGLCLLATSFMTHKAAKIIQSLRLEGLDIGLIDFVTPRGFDETALVQTLKRYSNVLTLEEGFGNAGGVDCIMKELLYYEHEVTVHSLAVKPAYVFEMGSREDMHVLAGIGEQSIKEKILKILGKN